MKNQTLISSWIVRIITIAFALFISTFALDVFNEGYGLGKTILALLIHLLPTFIVLTVLLASWRREWIGGISFLLLAFLYFFFAGNNIHRSGFALIDILLISLAVLYFIAWGIKTKSAH